MLFGELNEYKSFLPLFIFLYLLYWCLFKEGVYFRRAFNLTWVFIKI